MLKNTINQHWRDNTQTIQADDFDKENLNSNNQQLQQNTPDGKLQNSLISSSEMELVKSNIFQALELAFSQNKKVSSQIENIIYNIAQTDFNLENNQWPECIDHIKKRLCHAESEEHQLVGLRALKELVRAFQYDIDAKRKVIVAIGDEFLPIMEGIICSSLQNPSGSSY